MVNPRAPSYLSSRLVGYVTIGYIEPSSHDLANWSPRVKEKENFHNLDTKHTNKNRAEMSTLNPTAL